MTFYNDKEINLYEHQRKFGVDTYISSFLFVHDDTFGREFQTQTEIFDFLKDCGELISVKEISVNSEFQTNVFLLEISKDVPIDSVEDLFKLSHRLSCLEDIRYYYGQPCNVNLKQT